jgi:hypothetical protein
LYRKQDAAHAQPTLQKLDQGMEGRNVEVRIITITRIKIGIRLHGARRCGFLVVVKREFVVVIRRGRDLEYAGQPQIDVVGEVVELRRQLLTKQPDFVGRQRLIPEQET